MSNQQNNILTVLICCCNAGELLKECLDSLAHQNISDLFYKVLFVNDASTDNSLEIAKMYSKNSKNFTILNNTTNEGLVRCCNRAIEKIRTPYFIRLDADDWLSPDAVENVLKELVPSEKKDFFIFRRWDVWENEIKEIEVENDIYAWLAVSAVFSTEAVKSVGGYSDEYWEEYDLYVKLLEAGYKYKISPYRIYYYRRGHASMTQDYEKNKNGFESLLKKWKLETLKKYGNFEKILEYY